ncbi:MAG: heavy metal-binding domain-containing protein [Alphaproteobacteria bacterium]
MIGTTTAGVEGRWIEAHLGVVSGESVIGAKSVRDMAGGRAGAFEPSVQAARASARIEMSERAQALGASAAVGVSLDTEAMGDDGAMILVAAPPTAVRRAR